MTNFKEQKSRGHPKMGGEPLIHKIRLLPLHNFSSWVYNTKRSENHAKFYYLYVQR